jgi:hypothetical protein
MPSFSAYHRVLASRSATESAKNAPFAENAGGVDCADPMLDIEHRSEATIDMGLAAGRVRDFIMSLS